MVSKTIRDVTGKFSTQKLRKPEWILPNHLFLKTWASILGGMGLASYLVWRSPEDTTRPLLTYCLQLTLTWAWTPLFFKFQSPLAGLLDIAVLLPTVDVCTYQFFEVSTAAGLLMLPYQIWLTYIIYLNYRLYILNR